MLLDQQELFIVNSQVYCKHIQLVQYFAEFGFSLSLHIRFDLISTTIDIFILCIAFGHILDFNSRSRIPPKKANYNAQLLVNVIHLKAFQTLLLSFNESSKKKMVALIYGLVCIQLLLLSKVSFNFLCSVSSPCAARKPTLS